MHAWYSVKQARLAGTALWRRADGTTVEVSMVGRTKEHGTRWNDIAYLGEVVEPIKRASGGFLDSISECTPENIVKLKELCEWMANEEKRETVWN